MKFRFFVYLTAAILTLCSCESKKTVVDIHNLAEKVIEKGLQSCNPGDYRGAGLHEAMASLAVASGRRSDWERIENILLAYGRGEVPMYEKNNFIIFDGGGLGTAILCQYGSDTLKRQFLETAERAWRDQPRTRHDNLMTAIWTKEARENDAVFIDIIGSTASYFMYAGQVFGRSEWTDYGMMEGMALLRMFRDSKTGLLHQGRGFGGKAWDELDTAFWSRGNGWGSKAMMTFIRDLDKNHPMRKEMEKFCEEYFSKVCRYQDGNGLFHQEITDTRNPASYPEISGTCNILMGLAACIKEGILDESYRMNFEKGLRGVLSYVDPDGSVGHTCEGCLCPGDGTSEAYEKKAYWYNEDHAFGPLVQLLASALELGYDKITVYRPLGWANEGDRFEKVPLPRARFNNIGFDKVRVNDSFWSPILDRNKNVTIPVCISQMEEQTARIRNFENAASGTGPFEGKYYDDSDVYKALEGFAYTLKNNPDPALEKKCDEWIDKICAAQQSDGYLNTYHTINRLPAWTDMREHEMYMAGHLIEAAIAYRDATSKTKLFDAAVRFADYIMEVFGPDKRDWVPGHEEIELAMVKLGTATGDAKYIKFADWLLSERGKGIDIEGGRPQDYYQNEVPVKNLEKICGHAVRAMYLFCAMTDLSARGYKGYEPALERVWENLTEKNMYITGGIGSSGDNEGFTKDYDLPNKEAYCETCASIGQVLWNSRMAAVNGDGKYYDIVEKCLYNGVLSGISVTGDRFFYVNPLESDGTHHRQAWFGTACCPSNLCRFLPSIGGYIYGISRDALWINNFIGSTVDLGYGQSVTLTTFYPWGDTFILDFDSDIQKDLRIRIPSWCEKVRIRKGQVRCKYTMDNGYAVIKGGFEKGERITVKFSMPVKTVESAPQVRTNAGKLAVMRGPLVYCAEEVDNNDFDNVSVSAGSGLSTSYEKFLLGGTQTVTVKESEKNFYLIPYCLWDNRNAGRMKVWL